MVMVGRCRFLVEKSGSPKRTFRDVLKRRSPIFLSSFSHFSLIVSTTARAAAVGDHDMFDGWTIFTGVDGAVCPGPR
jgi:hypothetical protein